MKDSLDNLNRALTILEEFLDSQESQDDGCTLWGLMSQFSTDAKYKIHDWRMFNELAPITIQ
jgi:hypothetical protein